MTLETVRANLQKLEEFLSRHPEIQHVTSSSPEYDSTRATFVARPDVTPSAIVRPPTIEDAVSIVSFLITNKIEFTVRVGGHDMLSRTFKDMIVGVDLRLINHVAIDENHLTARVGGGILIGDLSRKLHEHGLATATGTISPVGYVGWAMYGGYGPYSTQFGLGVDHIIAAKIINAQGALVEADADLLKAIRGAGGAFGVLVEVTIQVHRLDKILAGVLFLKSDDISAAVRQYNEGYRRLSAEGIPAALTIAQAAVNTPQGLALLLLVNWSSPDFESGKIWVDKISRLAPVVLNTVKETTPPGWLEEAGRLVPRETQGRMYTINAKAITNEVVDVISTHLQRMPSDPHIIWNMHELRRSSPSARPRSDAVFAAREGHFMFEIVSIAEKKENLDSVLAWGKEFQEALYKTDPDNILAATYLSMTAPDEIDLTKVFGEHYELLREFKQSHDPHGVFSNGYVRF
ncbi:hypothetical protein ETB97_010949 [Aspergillus alliaceus]|uniref:FAD-binding PCMH-type domain-containing protein n=1 Tax=Petromyces alliaceus TaxID=209559 RepID=A0A8H6E8V6_PETAA|nr:hypothetical protein ETB97_010949 [Aspergillus burnettii]